MINIICFISQMLAAESSLGWISLAYHSNTASQPPITIQSVSGLVVKSIVAIDGPRVRFAADAFCTFCFPTHQGETCFESERCGGGRRTGWASTFGERNRVGVCARMICAWFVNRHRSPRSPALLVGKIGPEEMTQRSGWAFWMINRLAGRLLVHDSFNDRR